MSDAILGWLFGGWSLGAPRDDADGDGRHQRKNSHLSLPGDATRDTRTAGMETDDHRRVAKVRAGDVAAFEGIVREYVPRLLRVAVSYAPPEFAEDIIQDVFTAVWQRRATWEIRESLLQFLVSAVRYQAFKTRQQHASRVRRDARFLAEKVDPIVYSEGPRHVEEAEYQRHLLNAVAALPPRCREIFLLSRRDGLSSREIATALGIAVGTVKVQLWRAFRTLEAASQVYRTGPKAPTSPQD